MREHEQHTAFLKVLINHQSQGDECKCLEEKLTETIAKERCIRRAVVGVVILGALSIAGVGYSAVLLPSFFQNTPSLTLKVLNITGLASGISLAFFLPIWGQTRHQLRKLHRDCRRTIMGSLKKSEKAPPGRTPKVKTAPREDSTDLLRLPKAT